MSVAKCAKFCSQFDLFGVEYGRECWCGNTRDSGSTKVDSSECSFTCPGNDAEKCGAGDRLNIYTNAAPVAQQAAKLTGVTSLGCFVDNGNRVLPNRYTSSGDMTAAKCAENCAGYTYFGTQWSSECYCGNTVPTVSAPASECNMACSGNDDELCGGGMRLNAYKIDPVSATASSTAAPQPTVSSASTTTISGYEYKGCYTDNVPQRVLAGKSSSNDAMTLEMCAAFCKVGGYSWFGVEYNFECYCGTKLDALSMKEPESACAATCTGNKDQKCGGPDHLNVYMNPELAAPAQKTETSLNGFVYQSCWTDKVDDRSLKAVDYRLDDMTVEKCANQCKGYSYFGLEYSRECYCGNDLLGKAAPASECGMLCMGANDQWCGGPDRLNLYAQATVLSSTSLTSSTATPSATSELSSSITSSAGSSSITSSPADVITSSDSPSSPQFSSSIPSSTTMTPTTTTSSGPSLTTITNCPATPTFAGPEYCYLSGALPYYCSVLIASTNLPYYMASSALAYCKANMSPQSSAGISGAASCFPSTIPYNPASIQPAASSARSCLMGPSVSMYCQFDSACVTKTYTAGQEPSASQEASATATTGIDMFKDGGFEDGTFGAWKQNDGLNSGLMNAAVNSARPHTGSYGISLRYDNINGASVNWLRNMKLTPGKSYQLQLYYFSTNPGGSWCAINMQTEMGNLQDTTLRNSAANTWLTKTLTFKATKSWSYVYISFGCNVDALPRSTGGVNSVWLDDVTLKQID
ncbi:hypothetical protein N0V94_005848 [Neodidymelliopsis sp. IMI 364377]|nr:hypothetical protein N0V94_005848 [Neodidymelliopsis sp. IMI 364377]